MNVDTYPEPFYSSYTTAMALEINGVTLFVRLSLHKTNNFLPSLM